MPTSEQAKTGFDMTDDEIRQWIVACNYEPAKASLRHYLALRSLSAAEGGKVRVKPLEWRARDDINGLHDAIGADGWCRNIWERNGIYAYDGDPVASAVKSSEFDTLEAAKAAAQADYEARILSALQEGE